MNQNQPVQSLQKSSSLKWLLIILVIIIVLGEEYFLYQKYGPKSHRPTATISPSSATRSPSASKSASPSASTLVPADWKTYSNDPYGFSFKYPSDWKLQQADIDSYVTAHGIAGDEMVFKTSYAKYSNAELQASYQERSANGTKVAEPDEIANVYIVVFKPAEYSNLENWLVGHYKKPQTELEDYKVGKEVTLDGENGFLSSIGCCGGYDLSHVVKHGDYIYQLGTNDREKAVTNGNSLLETIASTFQFTE